MSINAEDRPNLVTVSQDETTVTVVAGVGATGPQGPQGPAGPISSLTVSSPLASTGGSSPNLSLGVVPVSYGGTGVGSLTGYVYGNGTSAFTAATTIPNSAVSGLGTMALQNATSIAVTGGYLADVSEEVTCTNRTGSPIAIGKAVYIIGAHGDVPEIALADASGESTAARTLGITAEAIADSGTGRVCFSGLLKGINTNSLTEGALVWLSETAGELTTTRPTQPAHGVFMGLCVKQAPGGAGILFVSVVNGQELEELHDVLITSPTAGQLFKRNTGNTLWVNASPASLTATSDTNVTLTLGGNASTALVNDASLTLGWTGTLAGTRLNTNVVQSVSNDTNVTGSINSQALTLGWTGVLAGTRLNSAVVQSVSNDTNVTGSINSQALALGWTGTLASSRLNANVVQTVTSDTNVTGSINSQAMTLGWTGQLSVGRGGTGASSLSGYLVGNGGSAFTAVSSIPGSAISGNITGNAANVTGIVAVTNGGSGVGSLTGYLVGNGTSAFTAVSSIPGSAISGNISGNATNVTGTVAVGNGGTGATSLTGYLVGNGSSAFTAVSSIPNTAISGLGTMSTQNASNVNVTGGWATGLSSLSVGTAGDTTNYVTIGVPMSRNSLIGRAQLSIASNQWASVAIAGHNNVSGNLGYLTFNRSRGTQSSPTTCLANDGLAYMGAFALSSPAAASPYRESARIYMEADADHSDSSVPGRITFGTTAVGALSPTNRLRITSAGDLAIGATAKLYVDGVDATGDTYLHESSANNLSFVTGGTERLRIDGSGNVGVAATTFGSSAANVFAVKNGTEPTSGPADTVQIYSVDRSAGNTIPAIYCEGTGVTDAGITSTAVTHKIAMKVNGTVYYLLATTNAT